jgi:hypothetical protein
MQDTTQGHSFRKLYLTSSLVARKQVPPVALDKYGTNRFLKYGANRSEYMVVS